MAVKRKRKPAAAKTPKVKNYLATIAVNASCDSFLQVRIFAW